VGARQGGVHGTVACTVTSMPSGVGVTSYLVKPTSLQEFTQMMDAFRRYWLELNHLPSRPSPL